MPWQRLAFTFRPNTSFMMLILVLIAVWYAARSHNNNAAYVLGFTMIGLAGLSMMQNYCMLRRLHVVHAGLQSAFAGGMAPLEVALKNVGRSEVLGVWLPGPGARHSFCPPLQPGSQTSVSVPINAPRRGRLEIKELMVSSLYPLGLFEGRRRLPCRASCLIYPKPAGSREFPAHGKSGHREEGSGGRGGDDFSGVRSYVAGESQRHVDWKAVARGQPLMVKQFSGGGEHQLDFDWEDTGGGDVERRLSQLTLWILEADRTGARYSLSLPAWQSGYGRGVTHRRRCLEALALYPEHP